MDDARSLLKLSDRAQLPASTRLSRTISDLT
jgi:hypothetical protein